MQCRFVSVNPAFMNCCTLSGMTSVQKLPAALLPFFAQENVAKTTHILFSHQGYFTSLAVFLPGAGEVKARCTSVWGCSEPDEHSRPHVGNMGVSGAIPPFYPSAIPLTYGTLPRSGVGASTVLQHGKYFFFQIKRNPKHQDKRRLKSAGKGVFRWSPVSHRQLHKPCYHSNSLPGEKCSVK